MSLAQRRLKRWRLKDVLEVKQVNKQKPLVVPGSSFSIPSSSKYSAIHLRTNHWRTHQQKQKHLYKTSRCHDHLLSKATPANIPRSTPTNTPTLFLDHPKIKEIEVPTYWKKEKKNQTTIPTWGRRLPCVLGTGRKGFCSDTKSKRHGISAR